MDFDVTVFEPVNPQRRPASPKLKKLAVETVQNLLDSTSMSMWAATNLVAPHVGRHPNSIRRWCESAGVSRKTALDPIREQYQRQVDAICTLNQNLAAALDQHDQARPSRAR